MKIPLHKILPFISAMLLFLLLEPYFVWSIHRYQYFIITIPVLAVFWIKIKKTIVGDIYMFMFFALILFLAGLFNNSNAFGIISLLSLAILPFISSTFAIITYKYFKAIYAIIIGISMLVWLFVFMGLSIPHYMISPLNTLKSYDYFAYPFLVIPRRFDLSIEIVYGLFKFHGPFDEPGVIGTISLLMLLIEDFKIVNLQNRILLMSGILSFSLFFFIVCFFYILYLGFFENKRGLLIVLFITISSFYFVSKNNDFMKEMLWNRLEWNNDNNTIEGNNRSDEALDIYFESIRGTSTYFFGTTDTKIIEDFSGNASYKNAILSFGILTCFLYLNFFTILSYKIIQQRKHFCLFLIFFLLTLYQRPGLFSINYIFLFVVFIFTHSKHKNMEVHSTSD